jgi:hypothetical protein
MEFCNASDVRGERQSTLWSAIQCENVVPEDQHKRTRPSLQIGPPSRKHDEIVMAVVLQTMTTARCFRF